jgi:hypothetical protein
MLTSLDEAELGDELRQAVRHEVTDEHVGNPQAVAVLLSSLSPAPVADDRLVAARRSITYRCSAPIADSPGKVASRPVAGTGQRQLWSAPHIDQQSESGWVSPSHFIALVWEQDSGHSAL